MWVRSAAIRPVPSHALLSSEALGEVEDWLGTEEQLTEERLNEAYEVFERKQPVLSERIGATMASGSDEVAMALGYFLSLVIFKGFDTSFGERLGQVDAIGIDSVQEALELDEQIRGADPVEAVDSDDVVAMEQPHVLDFVNEHIDAALDVHAGEVDVDAVHKMYRAILIEVLALSYAVAPAAGDRVTAGGEIYA